jgi:hypothetical protein
MKKKKFVCGWLPARVKGQKNINGQTHVFGNQLSCNQVFSGWESIQFVFFQLKIQPIRFRGAGKSANQVYI